MFSTLLLGDEAINTTMVHLNINPLSAGTYDPLDITARMFAASDNATTLIALIAVVQAPLDIWVANISGDVGAFNTLRTSDEAELVIVEAFLDYWRGGQIHNGFWYDPYSKFIYTDAISSRTTSQIMDFKDEYEPDA